MRKAQTGSTDLFIAITIFTLLFVLIVLLLTVGTSAILAMSSRSWKLPGLPRFKIPTVRIPFLQEETIVIEGRKKDYEQSLKVIESFKEKTESLSGVYGLYESIDYTSYESGPIPDRIIKAFLCHQPSAISRQPSGSGFCWLNSVGYLF